MPKKTIHFSDEDLKEQAELIDLLGLSNVYGALPKAIKLSITFTKEYIHFLNKVIPDVKISHLDTLFSSVKKLRKEEFIRKEAKKIGEKIKR